jgi:PIN domain nuclease of toxin-antitoxin system
LKLLLDTHALLWFATNDAQLSRTADSVISDSQNEVFVSPASYWERAIKVSLGKYPLSVPFETFITNAIDGNQFRILPVEPKHVAEICSLPHHHRDPFDRLIIAQAIVERMTVVSSDREFAAYPVTRLW